MRFRYKRAFLKRFDRFPTHEKELIIVADKEVRNYYLTHNASFGLKIKKLYDYGLDKVFEARVTDSIRILWVVSEDLVTFVVLGNHDEIRNYIEDSR